MKHLRAVFALLVALTISTALSAQSNNLPPNSLYKTYVTISTGAQQSPSVFITNGYTLHALSWNPVTTTSVTGCSVQIDSSPDGVTWTSGGIIAAQTCNSAGSTTVSNVSAAYARINFTAITAGQVSATYTASNPLVGKGSQIPTPPSSGLCFTSTGSTYGAYTWGSCSGTASTNWSSLVPGTGSLTTGTYNVPTGATLQPSGGGVILASTMPWSGLTGFPTGCTNQAVTSVGATLTCSTITPAFATGNTSGSGNFALVTSPVFITPTLGAASGTSLTLSSLTSAGQFCVHATSAGLLGLAAADCGSGGGSTNFQVDGNPLISATTVNFQDANVFNGLTIGFSNPSAGNVKLTLSGTLANAGLTNSSVTVNGTANQVSVSGGGPLSLGGTATISITNPFIFPGKFTAAASVIGAASLNIPTGTAPTSPVSGDIWNASGIAKFFDGTNTNSFVTIQSALVSGNVPKASGTAGLLVDSGIAAANLGLTTSGLNQFAATTSAQLAGVLSDEISVGSTPKSVFAQAFQGTDVNLMTAGTVSGGAGTVVCLDASGGITTVSCSGGGSPAGGVNAVQYELNSTTFGGVAAPTTNGLYQLVYNVTASTSVAPTAVLSGLGGRAVTGATSSDTFATADNGTVVNHDKGATANLTETLPLAATLLNANYVVGYCNHTTSQSDTITATSATIQLRNATAAASITVAPGACVRIKVDPNSTTNWLADGGVVGPATSTPNDVMAFADTLGQTWVDTSILYTNLVTASSNFSTNALSKGVGSNKGLQVGDIQDVSNGLSSVTQTQAVVYQGGTDGGTNAALGNVTVRGADQTGAGGASSAGGGATFRGGNNAATNTASEGGSYQLYPGASTGATQGLQGLGLQETIYVKGATVTQWNLQCESAAMTVADCAASPQNWLGVAEGVATNTVPTVIDGQTPVNASAAVTLGHTVCAGSTAGKVTDSGGTSTCASGSGTTVGVVMAVAGTWTLPDGTNFTASTTLPVIQLFKPILQGSSGSGVTSVGFTIQGTSSSGIFAVTGSPVTTSGPLNLNLSGTQFGLPYFSTTTVLSSSGAPTAHGVWLGEAGAPVTTSTGAAGIPLEGAGGSSDPAFGGQNLDIQGFAQVSEISNNGTTAPVLNKLVKLTGAPSTVTITATSDTTGILGICLSNCSTTGNAQIALDGIASCVFDGATTAGDYVENSATTAGDCHDVSATRPNAGQVLGRVLSTNGAGGTFAMLVSGVDDSANAANPQLSNLVATVAVNLALSPGTDNSISLDDLSHRYINFWSSGVYGWTNGSGTADTGLSRGAAGVVAAGNGTAGDTSAQLQATSFLSEGSVAAFIDFPQGSDPTSTAPCNTANSICEYAPTAVTAYFVKKPAAAPVIASYSQSDTCASSKCTMSFHPAPVALTVASDFTTAANTSLQTITGLSYTLPVSQAEVVTFHCQYVWAQATGTAAVAFGIQGATTAPTNLEATATSYTSATGETTGTLTALSTTIATSIVSVAPSVVTTKWKAIVDGTLEAPSNASPTVLNFMVSTATSGDAVTISRGSSCTLLFQ